jgi:putative photosynthetic complex assembly protein 2
MRGFGFPWAYAALAWWFTTGAILYLDGRAVRTFRYSMGAATLVLAAALYEMRVSAADAGAAGAYTAFSCAILVWGWLEMAFLMGYVTGPRKTACSAHCPGWRHFIHATQAVIYNELATVVAAGAVFIVTWGMPNRLALWTFVILWTMRISAKLNLFFGVPNLGERFLPSHLQYLKSFFRRRAMNALFPVSITASTVALVLLVEAYVSAKGNFQSVSYALSTTLLGLAVLEHWFMVLPLPSERLWAWAFRAERTSERTSAPPLSQISAGGASQI